MEIEVISEDGYGQDSYSKLFEEIMTDIGKASLMGKVRLILRPEIPLFIFSIRLRSEPSGRTIADVANIRGEDGNIHLTVTDERYAPELLSILWQRYGRDGVNQQTRFDMEVVNAVEKEISCMVVASGEKDMKEIIGALWRSMPEGIKNRHTYADGPVITVVATEEIFQPFMLEEGRKEHERMMGEHDV